MRNPTIFAERDKLVRRLMKWNADIWLGFDTEYVLTALQEIEL